MRGRWLAKLICQSEGVERSNAGKQAQIDYHDSRQSGLKLVMRMRVATWTARRKKLVACTRPSHTQTGPVNGQKKEKSLYRKFNLRMRYTELREKT